MASDVPAGGPAADLQRLSAEQSEIRAALAGRGGRGKRERAELLERLARNRQEMARLWESNGGDDPASAPADGAVPGVAALADSGEGDGSQSVPVDDLDELLQSLTAPGRGRPGSGWRRLGLAGAVGAVASALLIGIGVLVWQGAGRSDGAGDVNATQDVDIEHEADEMRLILAASGLPDVAVVVDGSVIRLVGPVPTAAQLDGILRAAKTFEANGLVIDTSGLTVANTASVTTVTSAPGGGQRAGILQRELDRILDATPLVFSEGQSELSELQKRVLGNVAVILGAYPDLVVQVAGYTDDVGSDTANAALSAQRAATVRDYLVSLGVPATALTVTAEGERAALGGSLAGLDRRVDLTVVGLEPDGPLQVAVVAPSARNDLAFTQSMIDALNLVATERPIEITVVDNTFIAQDVAAAVTNFAIQGYDLVIAHGSQFGPELLAVAAKYPEVTFAWGTAADTSTVAANVYAYSVAADQGGYVLGALAATTTRSGIIGVIGPIEVGDAKDYIDGFVQGAKATRPDINVKVTYTGSFSDLALAAETARAHIAAGADVLTGSSQMVPGAITVAQQANATWIANQADQASLAPTHVAASQVYHWEVILRPILDDITSGNRQGRLLRADLANGGITIALNPARPLPPEHTTLIEQLTTGIRTGTGPGPN